MCSNLLPLFTCREIFVGDSLWLPARLLSGEGGDGSGYDLIPFDVGYPSRSGILDQLMVGGRHDFHHVKSGSPEYRVMGGFHVHVKLHDDIIGVRTYCE